MLIPYVTDEEYKKFKELLDKEKNQEEYKKLCRKVYVDKLTQYKEMLLDLNKSYGKIEAYALTFAKWLNEFFDANKVEEYSFNWDRIKTYITDKCLEESNLGTTLRQSFRKNMKSRGFAFIINRKYNMVTIKREKPKSMVK